MIYQEIPTYGQLADRAAELYLELGDARRVVETIIDEFQVSGWVLIDALDWMIHDRRP